MKNFLSYFLFVFFSYSLSYAQTPAFPGAEGGGMYTTGGRGGTVYYVNTLEDNSSGNSTTHEGSLRWCVNQSGKRTILFKVGGTIMLKDALKISNGNVTIAGQTAPGGGICIGNDYVDVSGSNVILRFLRFRMGDDGIARGGSDALGGRFFTNVIVDHCSICWSTDECVSFYNCNNFTLQWCIASESLRLSNHDKGPHGYGGIWGGTNASFHHNLLAHHDSRAPRFGAGSGIAPHTETVDHRNNVIYNYGNVYGGEAMNINIVNNFYKPGPSSMTGTKRGRIMSIDMDTNVGSIRYNIWGQFYINGNVVDDGKNETNCTNATNDNWTYGVYNQFASGYGTVSDSAKKAMKMSEAFDIKGLSNGSLVPSTVTTHTARNAYNQVLLYAGASLNRDSYDTRIITEVQNGTTTYKGLSKYNGYDTGYPGDSATNYRSKNYPKAGIIDSQWDTKPSDADSSWTPWPVLASGTAVTDTDGDGIPDEWLEANGYSGKSSTDTNDEGYTYLEVYLNSLVESITSKQNENAISGIEAEKSSDNSQNASAYYDKIDKSIHVNTSANVRKVSLFNLSGALISEWNGNEDEYSISSLKAGLYLVKIVLEDNRFLVKKVALF